MRADPPNADRNRCAWPCDVSRFRDVNGGAGFYIWEDGERTVYFDPLLRCGAGLDPVPAKSGEQ